MMITFAALNTKCLRFCCVYEFWLLLYQVMRNNKLHLCSSLVLSCSLLPSRALHKSVQPGAYVPRGRRAARHAADGPRTRHSRRRHKARAKGMNEFLSMLLEKQRGRNGISFDDFSLLTQANTGRNQLRYFHKLSYSGLSAYNRSAV